jgi:hypothetical protein
MEAMEFDDSSATESVLGFRRPTGGGSPRALVGLWRARKTIAALLLAVACLAGFWSPEALVGNATEFETVELEESSEIVRSSLGSRRRVLARPTLRTAARIDSFLERDVGLETAFARKRIARAWGRLLLHRQGRLLI